MIIRWCMGVTLWIDHAFKGDKTADQDQKREAH